ncbi:MAG: type II toxin-antitoxin system Phd/YefM family antitoxin [Micrococcales bacterium]|nr:type II toxin-antitoxin system Phd/YefM family antitoxin [Micrococcales bacterium]
MDAPTIEQRVRFSDLSRDSKAVAEAAERGPVTITRRDGEALVLMLKSEADADRAGLALASQIIAVAVTDWPDSFAARLRGPFPWMLFLSETAQEEFAAELVETARACASIARFEPLATVIHAWQSTAEAHAAGWTGDGYDWLDSPVDVERPGAGDQV